MSEAQKRTQLGALLHGLEEVIERLRAQRDSAVAMRDNENDEERRAHYHEVARACANGGNAILAALLKVKQHAPQSTSDAAHEPISPQ